MPVEWDPSLALGHAEIDGQHKEIFRRFGALVLAIRSGDAAEIGVLFEHLGEYVSQHFAAEERVMAETAYPGAGVHAAQHARFAREYRELLALYEAAGPTAGILVKTRTWIEGWLRTHITGVDQALAAHLRGRWAPPTMSESGRRT
jgi:hemerythrin